MTGALTSGCALFVASGLLSPVPGQARGIIAVCALLLLVVQFTGLVCLDLPENARQIPRETFHGSPTRAAFRFAFELGSGVRTYITANSPYGAALIMVLVLPPDLANASLAALAVSVGYGLGRSIVVAAQSMRRSVAVSHPPRWLQATDLASLSFALGIAMTFLVEQ